ncbi:single-stranded DNA-binding protein [Botrimarina mediterranea]|uniref:Single-stranded DNA-binding protein n=1 Tax=Botrimarina mediterranea TaxID=2528022 RepID=A0A518K608_9BACT|nr:single-stranded DNA-binding protein [Botrimarina mediterranea]QDV73228.1 single-stranded DNA-binding protein [Botrimarina mediterranea]
MLDFAEIQIEGRLVSPLVVKQTTIGEVGEGTVVANSAVRGGEGWIDQPMFIDFAAFGVTISPALRDAAKGDRVRLEGFLRFERWEQDGQKRSKHKVIARTVRVEPKVENTHATKAVASK